MAVTYGFYNSLNGDRKYNAEDVSHIFNGIITDGVFSTIGDALMTVAGTGMQVVVKTGKCWFNGTWTMNDSLLPLDIEAADVSLTRIDAVVVEVDTSVATRANSIKIVKGTASANPTNPTMKSEEFVHQYPIAYITVSAGVTSITADKISVNVGKDKCPFITSVLQQTDISDLFTKWETEFETWFANVQNQLSGDVAANLQRQIDANTALIHQNEPNEATKTLLQLGTNGTSNDAWQTLFLGVGKVVAMVEVLDYDSTPKSGVTITGGTALEGRTLVTDENGVAYCNCSNGAEIGIIFNSTQIEKKTFASTGVITKLQFRLHRITIDFTNSYECITHASANIKTIENNYNQIIGYIINPEDTDSVKITSRVSGYIDSGSGEGSVSVNKNSYNNLLTMAISLNPQYGVISSSKVGKFSPAASEVYLALVSGGDSGGDASSSRAGGGGNGGGTTAVRIYNSGHVEKSVTITVGAPEGATSISGAVSASVTYSTGPSGGSGWNNGGTTGGNPGSTFTTPYTNTKIPVSGGGGGGNANNSDEGGGSGGYPYGGAGAAGTSSDQRGHDATGYGGGGGGGGRYTQSKTGAGGNGYQGAVFYDVKYD